MAAQVNDLRKIRRKKNRRRFFRKLLLFVIVISLALTAYITKDKWLPMFEGVVDKYKQTIVNDGKLAEGNFPVKVSSSSQYSISGFDSRFAVLTDTHFYTFEKSGSSLFTKQHKMSNPVMKAANNRILLYDLGGFDLSVESKNKTVFGKTLSSQIVFADISSKNYTAVVTKSDKYASAMTIYDESGAEKFFSSSSQKIIDVEFNKDSTGCHAVMLGASGGKLISTVTGYSFSKSEVLWKSQPINTLVIDTAYMSNGKISVIGDTQFNIVSGDGVVEYTYTYRSKLVGCSTSGDITALITENSERRRSHLILFTDSAIPIEIELDSGYRSVLVKSGKIFLLTDNGIVTYSSDGETLAVATLTNDYIDFTEVDNYIYLLGASIVDRINYKS